MITKSGFLMVALAFLAAGTFAEPAFAKHKCNCAAMKVLNPDRDGTIDWHEARRAAKRLFHRLDTNHDGKLDLREVRGRVGIISFARANPDRDRTLELNEFLSIAKHRFHRANPDNDGTIDCRELHSLKGRKLQKVLL